MMPETNLETKFEHEVGIVKSDYHPERISALTSDALEAPPGFGAMGQQRRVWNLSVYRAAQLPARWRHVLAWARWPKP